MFKSFSEFFRQATRSDKEPAGRLPFPYQERFAVAAGLPELVHAPTGAGKTATTVLGWLWRRLHHVNPSVRESTPRRLVYCLPMRVLVEQTRDEAQNWLKQLGLDQQIKVHVLMGGEEVEEWDLQPEKAAILIGTQDMLLSRALNRGYGMSRFRWPMHYGLLNNDCLWILDEIQLMGTGLATSTQIQAFREALGTFGSAKTVWMSATLLPGWLASINFRDRIEPELKLGKLVLDPKTDYKADGLRERWEAKKPVLAADVDPDNLGLLANFVKEKHEKTRSLTLVIVNTVDRCRELFEAIRKAYQPPRMKGRGRAAAPAATAIPDLKLIHSRFRPKEREAWRSWLTEDAAALRQHNPHGRIVVSTQVVEAGVDLSAQTLITALAPWPSLVQRFGRCNRRGEFLKDDPAQVYWVDVLTPDDKKAAPYSKVELDAARERIESRSDVGLKSLTEFFESTTDADRALLFPFDPPHVIRRKDFIDLFDTTPDLAGNDIDISRYIRDGDDLDVQVFWRNGPPDQNWAKAEVRRQAPRREELCSVSFVRFREDFLRKDRTAFRWDALDGKWTRVSKSDSDLVYPGQVYWIDAEQGGYDATLGWDPTVESIDPELVLPLAVVEQRSKPDAAYDDDDHSRYESGWQTVAEHTQEVFDCLTRIAQALPLTNELRSVLATAARWHDWGKAHEVFQAAITKPASWKVGTFLAKAPDGCWNKYSRKHFRHELASALGVLALLKSGQGPTDWMDLATNLQNLGLYLIAAHHGKVRLSIRSLPGEEIPKTGDTLFARGVWGGDKLPTVDLGGGVTSPATENLDLSPMLLGRQQGQASWIERMLTLREHRDFGPLRLAFLEAILRAADIVASKAADARAKGVTS